jgi:molybdenum cofactor guanylyltransferase
MPEIDGFILAGGASSRMGRDKSRLLLGGRTLVGLVADALSAATPRVRLVSARHEADDFGLRVIRDIFSHRGPLAGIHAALAHAESAWAFVASCDMPFVTGDLVLRLASYAEADHDAVVPVQPDGRPQPLCALYARDACLAAADELLRAGETRPRALLSRVRTRLVPFGELADLPRSSDFFTNVNTPDDYEKAEGRKQ